MKRRYLVLRFLVTATGRYALNSLKNCVRILTGRKFNFNVRGSFSRRSPRHAARWPTTRLLLLHMTGLRPIRKITCTGLSDEGAGSQALMIMNAINFARAAGLSYVHTPFTHIHHAERPMQEWVTAWESFFNLGAGELAWDADRRGVVNFCYNFVNLDLCLGWRGREDDLANNFKSLIPEFRRKYYLNKSPRTTDELTVAIHIRRGDALPGNPYFTGNEQILRTVSSLRSILETHKVKHRICIYSQGNRADFADLALPGVEFFLDVDAIWTLQELIEADVLIMAQGCFSYCAGLISDGIKIFDLRETSVNDLPG